MALKSGVVVAQAIAIHDEFIIVQQFFSLIVCVSIYQGILQLAYVIQDPLGDNILNFPITGYIDFVTSTVDAMFGASTACPIVAENGVLHDPSAAGLSGGT